MDFTLVYWGLWTHWQWGGSEVEFCQVDWYRIGTSARSPRIFTTLLTTLLSAYYKYLDATRANPLQARELHSYLPRVGFRGARPSLVEPATDDARYGVVDVPNCNS